MIWLRRGWLRILVGLVPLGLILAACSGSEATAVSDDVQEPAPISSDVDTAITDGTAALLSAIADQRTVTINIALTDTGFDPAWVFVPEGREVQLVFRNRGETEYHYRVVGLEPENLLWINVPEDVAEEGVTDDEHDAHHASEFVPWRATSRAGIKPTGDEVHAYVSSGGNRDVVRFVAPAIGTYSVVDPLHPEFTGELTVY
ncbi:MAG: hypothetical protein O3C10_11335 [Chloroflexi bacterium]|nr:hypothetical protein [Chloroflexota bacterium]